VNQANRHTLIPITAALIVVAVMLYVPATSSMRFVPVFAQLSTDCANNGSNQVNAEVSKHSSTESNQVQSQANQCTSPPPPCPTGNTGTPSTEDTGETSAEESQFEAAGEVVTSGHCFPEDEDEPLANEEFQSESP
jgi:hypothetical protein